MKPNSVTPETQELKNSIIPYIKNSNTSWRCSQPQNVRMNKNAARKKSSFSISEVKQHSKQVENSMKVKFSSRVKRLRCTPSKCSCELYVKRKKLNVAKRRCGECEVNLTNSRAQRNRKLVKISSTKTMPVFIFLSESEMEAQTVMKENALKIFNFKDVDDSEKVLVDKINNSLLDTPLFENLPKDCLESRQREDNEIYNHLLQNITGNNVSRNCEKQVLDNNMRLTLNSAKEMDEFIRKHSKTSPSNNSQRRRQHEVNNVRVTINSTKNVSNEIPTFLLDERPDVIIQNIEDVGNGHVSTQEVKYISWRNNLSVMPKVTSKMTSPFTSMRLKPAENHRVVCDGLKYERRCQIEHSHDDKFLSDMGEWNSPQKSLSEVMTWLDTSNFESPNLKFVDNDKLSNGTNAPSEEKATAPSNDKSGTLKIISQGSNESLLKLAEVLKNRELMRNVGCLEKVSSCDWCNVQKKSKLRGEIQEQLADMEKTVRHKVLYFVLVSLFIIYVGGLMLHMHDLLVFTLFSPY